MAIQFTMASPLGSIEPSRKPTAFPCLRATSCRSGICLRRCSIADPNLWGFLPISRKAWFAILTILGRSLRVICLICTGSSFFLLVIFPPHSHAINTMNLILFVQFFGNHSLLLLPRILPHSIMRYSYISDLEIGDEKKKEFE